MKPGRKGQGGGAQAELVGVGKLGARESRRGGSSFEDDLRLQDRQDRWPSTGRGQAAARMGRWSLEGPRGTRSCYCSHHSRSPGNLLLPSDISQVGPGPFHPSAVPHVASSWPSQLSAPSALSLEREHPFFGAGVEGMSTAWLSLRDLFSALSLMPSSSNLEEKEKGREITMWEQQETSQFPGRWQWASLLQYLPAAL